MNRGVFLAAAIVAVAGPIATFEVGQAADVLRADFRHTAAPTIAAQQSDVNIAQLENLMSHPNYRDASYTQQMMDIHMKVVGSIVGYAAETPPPASPTTFSFKQGGKTVYVDYGLSSQSKTLQELERRVAGGKAFVDLRGGNAAKLDATTQLKWEPAGYINGIGNAPHHEKLPAFTLTTSAARSLKLAPTMKALSTISGPAL